MKKSASLLLLIFCLITNLTKAQNAQMADGLRAEGKIYVIVLMIVIVLFGMITYLFLLDRKLNRMEKQINEKTKMNR